MRGLDPNASIHSGASLPARPHLLCRPLSRGRLLLASLGCVPWLLLADIVQAGEVKRAQRVPRLQLQPERHESAWPMEQERFESAVPLESDRVEIGSDRFESAPPRTAAAVADTIWFADWGFGVSTCDASGWTVVDNRILNDGTLHWHMESGFGSQGGIVGQAAALGYHGDSCCESPDGYDNDWYQAIRITYTGAATLSFDYLLDTEEGDDFLQVEADSGCSSFDRVDYRLAPGVVAAQFRQLVATSTGWVQNGHVAGQSLPAYGPGVHCVYLAFLSDPGFSPCDGRVSSTLAEGLVVDNIVLSDASGTRNEDFADGTLDIGSFVNLQDSEPFGVWARLHRHATDNELCGEVRDCAWIFSDRTLLSPNPDLRFGPGGAVMRNWLDNVIISPWVNLPPPGLGSAGTVLRYRVFAGSNYQSSRIVNGFSVRIRRPSGGGAECVSSWRGQTWNSLNSFSWLELQRDLTPYLDPDATAIQVRYRVSDWQYISGIGPPNPFDPGPGPYLDRVRLGRRMLQGPLFSPDNFAWGQAQDNFPSVLSSSVPVEDYTPGADRFGASDFSPPYKHMGGSTGHIYFKTSDSLNVIVKDARAAGGLTGVHFNARIVAGPHAGKTPPPWTAGPNGFFQVPADSVRDRVGVVLPDRWFADLDDRYFRGGDVVLYFWSATDAAGGYASLPDGLSSDPATVEQAEAATGGLFEVSFLPAIDWDPAYLARIQADPHGKLEPTAQERAASRQRNCILYQRIFSGQPRRSGSANRTSFMYALDRLGYAGAYDVYDQLGAAIANSKLVSRAALEMAGGYALIVVDAPNSGYLAVSGLGLEGFLDQSQWYQDWLARAASSAAGRATLWLIGNDMVNHSHLPGHVIREECATTLIAGDVDLGVHPQVLGQNDFTFADGSVADFTPDAFALATGICGRNPRLDTLGSTGTGAVTHRYVTSSGPGDGAVVMNANPAADWNTVMMSFNWNWLGNVDGTVSSEVTRLVDTVLRAALADSCEHDSGASTGIPDEPGLDALPRLTALLPNVPNPFNPVTTIHFDLALDGAVQLRIHDVAGRVVRTLVNGPLARRHHELIWDGLDDGGRRVPSGVYLMRLHTADGEWTRKLVALR